MPTAPCRTHFVRIVLLLLASVLGAHQSAHGAEGIPPATDAPRPLPPEESRKCFRLPAGFSIELVAAEPHLAEPTGMCFDARGRLFVCELHGYNLDGYYDVVELNRSGVLDTQVRRIPASKQAEERAGRETYGTVRLLEDTNGDGRIDRSRVFADHLPPCYGVIAARDGVIAIAAPDVIFLTDRDGDGKAEVQEKLFTGFGVGEIWTRISNPRWGVDNWIYVAAGQSSGGTIRGPHLKEPVQLGNTCFRFKADGSRLEPVSGGTSGFGLAFDDWDNRFLCTNQQHALYVAPLPYRDLARNPYQPGVDPVVNISSYGHPARVYPTSKPDPWRRKRGERPEWVKFYGPAETNAGLFTSACSPFIYRGDLFPQAYRGNHFSCEPAQNLIHRCLLEPHGTGFTARRAEESKEFVTSTDPWFRPVNLVLGPDGAMYVVDMYREIIEDYSAIPRYLQQQYVESLAHGRRHGRIWRIVSGTPAAARKHSLADLSSEQQVAELTSGNAWRRLTAQRLLVERKAKRAVPALKEMCRSGATAQARLHALYTLAELGEVSANISILGRPLSDEQEMVRVHALRLAGPLLNRKDSGSLRTAVQSMSSDESPRVRLQLAFTSGDNNSGFALSNLATLAQRDGKDPWMQAAILSAVPTRAGELAETLIQDRERGDGNVLLQPLARIVAARQPEEISHVLRLAAESDPARTDVPVQLLRGLAEGLAQGRIAQPLPSAGQRALEKLLSSSSVSVKQEVLRVAGRVGLGDSRAVQAARQAALRAVRDEHRKPGQRLASVRLLHGAARAELEPLADLLGARQPLELQLALVELLGSADGAWVGPKLVTRWNECTPRVQQAIVDSLCSRQDRLGVLLDALQKKTIEPGSVPSLRQTQLLENPDRAIRDRARALLRSPATSAERKKVLDRYQVALTGKPNLRRGKEVFDNQCAKCHALNGQGFAVGPDLAAIQNRPDESLLVDILDPSSTITAGYKAYMVETESGKVYQGVLAAETATSITLRREKGEQDVILRRDVERMTALSKSLMPDGLEKEIRPQDMASLLAYLRQALLPRREK